MRDIYTRTVADAAAFAAYYDDEPYESPDYDDFDCGDEPINECPDCGADWEHDGEKGGWTYQEASADPDCSRMEICYYCECGHES